MGLQINACLPRHISSVWPLALVIYSTSALFVLDGHCVGKRGDVKTISHGPPNKCGSIYLEISIIYLFIYLLANIYVTAELDIYEPGSISLRHANCSKA